MLEYFICAYRGGNYASVIVSRYFGAKEYGWMKTAVLPALSSFLGISLVLGIAGLILVQIAADMVGIPRQTVCDPPICDLFPGAAVLFMYT